MESERLSWGLGRLAATMQGMGDKSPKATSKQAAQKQTKANAATKKKNDVTALKQAAKTKK